MEILPPSKINNKTLYCPYFNETFQIVETFSLEVSTKPFKDIKTLILSRTSLTLVKFLECQIDLSTRVYLT